MRVLSCSAGGPHSLPGLEPIRDPYRKANRHSQPKWSDRYRCRFRNFCLIRKGKCGDKKAKADCITRMIRTFSVTELPNAVAAKGAQMAIRPKTQKHNTSADAAATDVAPGLRARSRRGWITCCLGVLTLGSVGCGSVTRGVNLMIKDVHECVDESMVDYRNRAMAEKAWIRVRHSYLHHQYHRDLKEGFVAGYMDVAAGSNGCTPAMAPSEYWGWRYQSSAGQAAINAWFQGYPYGAKAAEQDGIANYQNIRMNLGAPAELNIPGSGYNVIPGPANASFPDGEILPVPQAEPRFMEPNFDESPSDRAFDLDNEVEINEVEIVDPESVFHQPSVNEPWMDGGDESGIIADLEVATRPNSMQAAEQVVPDNGSQEYSDEFVNDLFGPPASSEAAPDSDELPFSFE